jgi:nicotinamidase-related amidase
LSTTIAAEPYAFPLNGGIDAANTALLVIDMQIDFCGPGGYIERLGIDLAAVRAPIAPIGRVMTAMRQAGFTIVHTRETFQPDLSDAQPHRLFRGADGLGIVPGDEGPLGRCLIQGEPCWDIIEELAPAEGEAIFDKNGYGAFGTTAIHAYLRGRGIANLVLTGVTSDCCIQSNLREALDRGYDCLTLEDCCGAPSRESHDHSMAIIRGPAGVFGALSTSDAVLDALK